MRTPTMSPRARVLFMPLVLFVVVGLAFACVVSSALALTNSERVYEKVSPAFKGGYGASGILGVEPDGEGVAFLSKGVFAGEPNDEGHNAYQAFRSGSGWSTVGLEPPASAAPSFGLDGFSSSLGVSLWELTQGIPNHQPGTEVQFAAHSSAAPGVAAGFESIGPVLKSLNGEVLTGSMFVEGFSHDLCHVASAPVAPLVAEALETQSQLYDISAGCHGEPPYVRLVALNSAGKLLSRCAEQLGAGTGAGLNAISGDGSEIFFDDELESNCAQGHGQLFVRTGGVRTLEVSKPLAECVGEEVPCPAFASRAEATFAGASEDGSRVFFTAPLAGGEPPLVPGADDKSTNLYRFSSPSGGELTVRERDLNV
ncbi:MAG: hypothetical protein ACRDK7_05985 [Solirubrobacteraceae bacterium]